jgi:sphingomyelin phosphodiesterase acid-like 3
MRRLTRMVAFVCIALAGVRVGAQPPPPAVGRVLLISDIHLDPLADPSIVRQLIAAPVAQWDSIFQSSQRKSLATYGSDSNYPLFSSTLRQAATLGPFDFVVFTGDSLRHDFSQAFVAAGGTPGQFGAYATRTAIFVVRELQRRLKAPVLAAIGNNDSGCGDYKIDPESSFLAALSDELAVLKTSPEAKSTFRLGGFFSLPHPTVANQDIVVLNSVFWSTSYSSCTPNIGDPGEAELQWLSWKLYAARLQHRGVTLVMHIPPGMNAYSSSQGGDCMNAVAFWQDKYATQFSALMNTYSDVVRLTFAGHTHMDDFQVSPGVTPSLPLKITPSVSPIFKNNPGISVLSYSTKTAAVSDITTFFIALSSGAPAWAKEYQFSAAYGVGAFSAATLSTVTAGIRSGGAARTTFGSNYAVSTASPMNSSNWPYYSCAQTYFTAADYRSCVCGAASVRARE